MLAIVMSANIAFAEPTKADLTTKLTTYIVQDSPQLNENDVRYCAQSAINTAEHAKRQAWVDTLVNNQEYPADASDKTEEQKAYNTWFSSLIGCIILSGTPESPSETALIEHFITFMSENNIPINRQHIRHCVKTSLTNVNANTQRQWIDSIVNEKTYHTDGPNAVSEMQVYVNWFQDLTLCIDQPTER